MPISEKLELDVELALCWAYQRELLHHDGLFGLALPRLAKPGWTKMIDTGTVVDEGREPRFPVAAGTPHPDALMLDYAVRSLPDVRVDWRAHREHLIGDIHPCWLTDADCIVTAMATAPDAVVDLYGRNGSLRASAKYRPPADVVPKESSVRTLVSMHARLGNRPAWDIGHPRVVRSKPVMVGRQIAKNQFTAGSRCPLRLEPSAYEFASARFEYAAWHQALVTLASVELSAITLMPPRASPRPWVDGDEPVEKAKVYASPSASQQTRLPLKPQRAPTLPPAESEIEAAARRHRQRRRKKPLTTPEVVA